MTTVIAWLALIVAVTALVVVALVMRQSADTTSDLRAHRRAHTETHGHPDPRLDRRQVQLGAPRSTGERRGTRYRPDPDDAETGQLPAVELPTSMIAAQRPAPPKP
jgi:hypothetical protein